MEYDLLLYFCETSILEVYYSLKKSKDVVSFSVYIIQNYQYVVNSILKLFHTPKKSNFSTDFFLREKEKKSFILFSLDMV